ncbi:MAG: hypothetical protein AAFQ42_07745 [Pseudomonadota bacterium]
MAKRILTTGGVLTVLLVWTMAASSVVEARPAAVSVQIAGTSLTLPTPDAHCPLEREKPSDARVLSMVEGALAGQNRLLGIYAPCDALGDWRSGKRALLGQMVQFQSIVSIAKVTIPKPYARQYASFCSNMRKRGQEIADEVSPEISRRIAKMTETIRVSEPKVIGVRKSGGVSCIVLVAQKIAAEDGSALVQLVAYRPLILKGKFVFAYVFRDLDNGAGVKPAISELEAIADATIAANGT